MAVSQANLIRYRAILIGREVKAIFRGRTERVARAIVGRFLLGWLMRWLFLAEEGKPTRAGEIVLAELRDRYALGPIFSNDPLVMARRAGRREVFDDVINWLNLDEEIVQQLMRIDDGLD